MTQYRFFLISGAYEERWYVGWTPCGRMSQFMACILVRGTIYYLMSRKNSKYYPDVHRYYSLLTEMSNHVTDWGNIPSDVAFTDRFNTEFGNRRTYWG